MIDADDEPETDAVDAPAAHGVAGTIRLSLLGADPALAQALRRGGAVLADAEPGPKQASAALLARFHYGLASARAGRLGDVRLIAQLFEEVATRSAPLLWPQPDGTQVDAARPEVDPAGLPDTAAATAYRAAHLDALAKLLGETETLILPLSAPALLCDPQSGRVAPRPAPGVVIPDWPEAPGTAEDLDAGFARLLSALTTLAPNAALRLIVLPAPAEASTETQAAHALVASRAAAWARAQPRVAHDPVLDALVARLATLPTEDRDFDRLATLIVRLCGGADLLDLVEGTAAPLAPPPETDRKARQKDPERRAKRKAKAEARDKGKTAKVMCEDELLEAFSK
ncbi:hypothetical protein ACTTAI_12125 [Rhodobacter capsulatus]|uniref:hypothetical protein n=1 Tax=Rhodobacter capsulatus TaxID=1061 RepID=UPI004028A9F7